MKSAALDCPLILVIAAALIWPLFQVEYFDNWMSIDGAFIADARFLSEHLPSPGWAPAWYCGNRYDYLYPPAMRYGSALIARVGGVSPARGYHIYSALLYCLSIAAVYALMRAGSGSRRWAWIAALASLTLSPVLLLFKPIRDDSLLHMPQRLNVIVKWGEVPHMSAMGVVCLALAAAWFALRGRRPALLATSAVLCAFAVSNNFYGATALAVFFPMLVWASWLASGDRLVWWRAAAIAALACALTAFWLTPSYLRLTAANLKLVALPGNTRSRLLALIVVGVFAAVSYRLARGRPQRAWPVFVCGSLAVFGLSALGGYYFQFQAVGESKRFVPEFDLLLILAAVECLRRRTTVARICGGAALAASLAVSLPYLRHPWAVYVPDYHPERRIEYRLTDWLARNLPGARVHTASSLGFWSGVWRDVPQVGGISDQGMGNQIIALANWQILMGEKPERDIYWLQALGADAIVVHGPRSQEIYHAIRAWRKYAGRLPVAFDSGQDDVVYRVPRRFPGLARVVERRRMDALPAIGWHDDNSDQLRAYAAALEQGPDAPAASQWLGTRAMRIRARLSAGESVAVQVSYDPAWQARSGGRRLAIRKDVMGFMRIDAPPGEHDILLEFTTPFENRAGRVASLAAFAVVISLWVMALRSRPQRNSRKYPLDGRCNLR